MSAANGDTNQLTVYGSAISYYTGKLEGYLRLLLSRKIADELLSGTPLPGFAKRFVMRQRQGGFYVRRDCVTRDTWDHVEGIYFDSWRTADLESRHDPAGQVPFRGRKVHYDSKRS